MSEPNAMPKAMRMIRFVDDTVDGVTIIDAVREAAGTHYVEELFFVDDEVHYMVGHAEKSPSGNFLVAIVGGPDLAALLGGLPSVSPVFSPDATANGVMVMHDYVGPKRHAPQPQPDAAQCYMTLRDFTVKLEAAIRDRMMDPLIVTRRPPVIAHASQLPGVTP